MREAPVECGHELCNCSVVGEVDGEAFCSDYCRQSDADSIESESCACGHPPCDIA
jgi:hypothetical protein